MRFTFITNIIPFFSSIPCISSSDPIITLLYYLGLIACVYFGFEKGKDYMLFPVIHIILNSFGGGLIRDTVFLSMPPWLFSQSALKDISIALFAGLLLLHLRFNIKSRKFSEFLEYSMSITDALCVGSFIVIGVDNAIKAGASFFIIVVCGYITGTFGGVTANFLRPYLFFSRSNLFYGGIAFIGSLLYSIIPNGYITCYFIFACLVTCNNTAPIVKSYLHVKTFSTYFHRAIPQTIVEIYSHYKENIFKAELKSVKEYFMKPFILFHKLRFC